MPRRTPARSDVCEILLESFAASARMNQLLLAHVQPRAWRAKPPNADRRSGRPIAAIFAHLHNSRLVWLKWSAPHFKSPAPLDPARCTIKQAATADRKSSAACLEMLRDALSASPGRRVKTFSRGSWAPEWPAGPTMFLYMYAHDVHHRAQVIMLAHQLGYRLPDNAAYGIWHWDKLWKELGFSPGPR
jgi:uncharacterized damage-inducible protein DinB